MPTELVYVPLEDAKLEATGLTIVSIAAVNDSRIALEMSASIKQELKWFERFACCRDRRGELYNSEAARRTGKMLAAAFVHETSRAKDPSLHMHVLIANVTIGVSRGQYGCVALEQNAF